MLSVKSYIYKKLSIKIPAIKILSTLICYVQTPPSAQQDLGTQPHKEAPDDI